MPRDVRVAPTLVAYWSSPGLPEGNLLRYDESIETNRHCGKGWQRLDATPSLLC